MSGWLPTQEFDAAFDRQWSRIVERWERRETARLMKAGFSGDTLRDLLEAARLIVLGPPVAPKDAQ
jgi:hypothetical protein